MTRRIQKLFRELNETGHSASITIADHLRTVAMNGRESATDAAMIEELRALRDAASDALAQLGEKMPENFTDELLHALHMTETAVKYYDEREGCPHTLQTIADAFAKVKGAAK